MLKKLVRALLLAGVVTMAPAAIAAKVLPPPASGVPVQDEHGNVLYIVLLRTDMVRALGDEGEAPPVPTRELSRAHYDFRSWHRADTRKAVRMLENEYGVQAVSMTSWLMPTFTAYLSLENLNRLEFDPRVEVIATEVLPPKGSDFSASPPWSNDLTGSDYISYAKIAMDMNDSATSSTKVHMHDAGLGSPNLGLDHQDLDSGHITQPWTGVSTCSGNESHSTGVAGVLSAEHNSIGIKGMNNAGTVVSVRRGCGFASEIVSALDYSVLDAETNGEYIVINISSNSSLYADDVNSIVPWAMRRASARALIIQAAGNNNDSACAYAFAWPSPVDGIMVVGAVNSSGAVPSTFDESDVGGSSSNAGSNYGSCVELYAPGQLIYTDYTGSQTQRNMRSGTSFAAPAVAAMAARYSNSMNPVVREAKVRAQLFSTGSTDPGDSKAVKIPSYTQSPAFTVPTQLTGSISANYTYNSSYSAAMANDGNYLSTSWNSGVQPSYPTIQPYLEIDLGSTKTLSSVRFAVAQSPSGYSTHDVLVDGVYKGSISTTYVTDGQMLAFNLGGISGRYVKLRTFSSPGWAAYYEFEVFGN